MSSSDPLGGDTDKVARRAFDPEAPTVEGLPPVRAEAAPRRASGTSVIVSDVALEPARRAPPQRGASSRAYGLKLGLAGSSALFLVAAIWLVAPLVVRDDAPPAVDPSPLRPVAMPRAAAPVASAPVATPAPLADDEVQALAPGPARAPRSQETPSRLVLDARTHVVDPLAAHAPDVELDPTHKYRLSLKPGEPRLGLVLARLEEAGGFGPLHQMATHAALQFGAARTLRLHCEAGAAFKDDSTFRLVLEDLARRTTRQLTVVPARDCLDMRRALRLELGARAYRVRVSTDTAPSLGPVPLKVAYLVRQPGGAWRAGTLGPGSDALLEGEHALLAIVDAYAPDNTGELTLELLSPDTVRTGLSQGNPGVRFVPLKDGADSPASR